MLGCLPESSAGVGATAQLSSLAEYVDLDSISLLAVDTGQSVTLDACGQLHLPDGAGTGFVPDFQSPAFVHPMRRAA
jgi:hypothetical protein